MAYSIDLSGPRSKLDRGARHVDQLRAEITAASGGDPKNLPLVREYDGVDRAVVYRIGQVLQIRPHWGLLVGDAVHNFRGALDHLAWQLVLKRLGGREPTKDEARVIYFPVAGKESDFKSHAVLKYLLPEDVKIIAAVQPYHPRTQDLHPLDSLALLSNEDKHRLIHVLLTVPTQGSFTNRTDAYRDCVPEARLMADGTSMAHWHHTAPGPSPAPGQEVLRAFVRPTGPNPDVEVDARMSGYVAVRGTWDVLDAMDAFEAFIKHVLRKFES